MKNWVARFGLATLICLLAGMVASGFAWYFTSKFGDLTPAIRPNLSSAGVETALSSVRNQILGWCIKSAVSTCVFVLVFLSISERKAPKSGEQVSSFQSIWLVVFILNIIACGLISYCLVPITDVLAQLNAGNYWALVFIINAVSILGFWIATLLFVKPAMRRSVPLSVVFIQ